MGLRQRLPSRAQISRWIIYALFACLFITPPFAQAAPITDSQPRCVAGVGVGGSASPSALAPTKGGNGCVVASYLSSGVTVFDTFNYTGDTQTITVPVGVTSITFYLIGAGGGGATQGTGTGTGGGGGFTKGTVAVTAGSIFSIIVGEGGGGVAPTNIGSCSYTPKTFGGGGRGGSCVQLRSGMMSSGGGRSAVRLSTGTNDLLTAAGGGGGGYQGVGGAGGGATGVSGTVNTTPGGSQTAGGAGGNSLNGFPGLSGTKYQGGDGRDESGGGGGGYYGGGGGGDNGGGGGGSSYWDTRTVTSGSTAEGSAKTPGTSVGLYNTITYNANGASSGSVPSPTQFTVTGGTRVLETNTAGLARTGYSLTGWNTQANGQGASYNLADTTFATNADITLYAEWSYTITYNANGATSGTAPTSQTLTGDSTTTLAINPGVLAITRGVLKGWNTQPDGSGTAYPGGQTNFSYDGNVTLYAMWGPATCIPTAGYSNCAVFPLDKQDLFFTLPANVPVGTIMQAEIWGAGGGVNGSSPTGGGGGGYSKVLIPIQTLRETFTVITGDGGSLGGPATYGGGGAGTPNTSSGSSGGGMSGIFSGAGRNVPLVISGGGGGASPGTGSTGVAGGGGGAGQTGNVRGTVADYTVAGSPGTLIAGGAAATNLSPCAGLDATSGTKYQGGNGAGKMPPSGTEGGGGGGGGYYGGGGGRCQVTSGPVQNGGGGGGSGFYDASRVTLVTVENGSNGIAGAGPTGGTTSSQYITGIGLGGGINNSGAAGDGLVVLQWGTETFTVTFDGNGGVSTAPSVSQSVVGATVTVADSATATRTGFKFLGWNTLATGLGTDVAVGPGYLPPSNITLYAKWSANSYVVIFDKNTPSGVAATGTMANMTIVAGTGKALTTNGFLRTGYVFRNWNSLANGTGTAYADLASVTFFETTTVYAQWNPILTYDINGGAGTVPVAVNVVPGTNVAAPTSTITRTGFNFAGWNTAANRSGTSYLVGDSITVTVPTTVYAMWKLTVTYNGNTPTTGTAPAAVTVGEFSAVTLPSNTGNLVKAGYIFVGWNTVIGGTGIRYLPGETFTPTANITLYADWLTACSPTTTYGNGDKVNTFATAGTCAYVIPAGVTAIDFLTVGGGGGGGSNVGQGGAGGALVYQTNVLVTSGQILIVTTGAAGATAAAGGASSITVGRTTYSANGGAGGGTFLPNRACATSRTVGGIGAYANGASGGNGSSGSGTAACNGDLGTTISITGSAVVYGSGGGGGGYSATAGTGGTNAGNGGNNIAGGAGLANRGGGGGGGGAGSASGGAGGSGVNIITFDYLSTINYDSNTATSGSITTTTWTQSYVGESLTVQSKGTLAKLGYSFTGWNTAANASGTYFQPGEVIAPQGNTTYYAIWVADTFTVTFNVNNGTGSMTSQLYTAAVSQALTSNANLITRTGFNFAGWTTNADGTGTSYVNNQVITLYAGVTLYAKWNANTYAVTFGSNTATGPATMADQNFSAGTPFNLSTSVWYKTGYDFAGWSAAAGVQPILYTQNQSVTLYANLSIYAQWTAQVYTVTYSNNGGTGTASIASQNYTYGSAAITSFPTVNTMTKTGYAFGGWSATPTGTVALTTLTPTTNQTLYAIWTAKPFNIAFNGNTSTSGTMANLSMISGTAKALTANAFLKTGFKFGSWNTVANGTGISYIDTQTVTLYSDTTTVTLYAQWSILLPATPTLTALAGNETATITITSSAAATLTAGAVTFYTVTALDASGNPVPGPLTCTVTPAATSCVIEGLTNKTQYKFSAVANNATGNSTAATTATSVTPQPFRVDYSIVNGGSVTPAFAEYDLGTPVLFPLPVRNGYNFTGWATAATGGTIIGLNGASYSPTGNVTVYATWTGIAYPITYNSNGGSATVPANGSYTTGGLAYQIAAAPVGMTKSGYIFDRWNTLSTGLGSNYSAGAAYETASALTLYAKWTAVDYTVTYLNSGSGTGTLPTQGTRTIGQTFNIDSGTALSNPGYSFSGWTESSTTYVAGDKYTVGSTNVILTAIWTPLQYLVLYTANGGSGTVPTEPTHSSGQSVTVASGSGLSKVGYTFAGWSESSTVYSAGSTFTMRTANATFVAQWIPAVFTVTYIPGLGTGNASRTSDSFTYGSTGFSLPSVGTMVRAGFIFNGWAETSTVITGLYAPTKSETLTAQWAPGTYTITYNTNGATGSPTGAQTSYTTSGSGLTFPGATGMTNTGYTLSGWSATPNGSVITGTFAPTTNTTLYAIWTPAQVTIAFNAGDVSVSTPAGAALAVVSTTRAFGSNYSLPNIDSPTVTISGQVYAFTGWKSSSGVTYAAGSSYSVEASGTTFTAQWIQQFVVTYVLNGGTAAVGDLVTDAQCANAGDMCNDGQLITTNFTPTRIGYNFTGWVDQGATSVGANASYTVSVGHYVLSAQWTPVTVTVNYAAAGGSSTPDPQSGSYLGTTPVANAITRTGYTFAGWSDGTLTYGAGATYRIETITAITLTAQWTANTYTISYDLNKGTSGSAVTTTSHAFASSATITSVVPTRTGYKFTYWLSGSNQYDSSTVLSMPAENLTLTAQWSAALYAVTYDLAGGNLPLPIQNPVAFGATFTLAATPTNPDATKNFLGWNDVTNTVAAGSTYTMTAQAITFTAQWSGALIGVSYTIAGATSGAAPTTEVVAPGTPVVVSAGTTILRSRFKLNSWSTGSTTVAPSSTIEPIVNTSLAAVWVPEIPDAPVETLTASSGSVTINVGQGAGTGGVPTSYTATASSGAQCTVNAPATSCTIAGLSNGTAYTFSVTASNSTGTSSASSAGPITPASVPSAPTSPVATIANGQANVSFTAPANNAAGNGGSPITSYTVTAYAPDGVTVAGTCTATAPIVSCLVIGLSNGTAYTYKVVANNAVGSSAASAASAPVTPATVPGAPATVSASASTSTTANVTVGAATVTGGTPITGYDVIATPVGGGTAITVSVTAAQIASAVTISGLAAGTEYTISTVAKNAVGSGVATTAASTITTPAAPPSAPTITSATATSTTAATVVVTAPTSNGGAAITGYSATLTPLGGGSAIVETSTTTTITSASLSSGTTYSVATTATNSSGAGTSSTASTFTTPLAVTTSLASETGTVGSAFTPISVSIQATSPTNTRYSITGVLPNGLTMDTSTGVISGTPTISSSATIYTITATTTVAGGATSTGTATVTIRVVPTVPGAPASVTATATSTTSANVSVGAATTTGGAAISSYTVTVSPVSSGAVGTATPSSAAISAPVAVSGLTPGTEYSVTAVANNSAGSGPSTATTATIATPVAVLPSVTSVSATVGNAISPVTTSIIATGETNTSFSIQGALPAGLSLNTTTGTISGTPTSVIAATQFTITATTTLPSGRVDTGTAVITLGVSPTTPTAPATATGTPSVTTPTAATVVVTPPSSNGGSAIETYTVTVNPVNTGLSVTATSTTTTVNVTGLQAGTQYIASVTASNAAGAGPSVTTSIFTTNPALSTSVSSATGVINTPLTEITTTLLAEAGSTATYAISGTLPAGLVFDTATGTISGTPTTVTASANYTITATALVAGVTKVVSTVVGLGVTYSAPTAPLAAIGIVSAGATTTASVSITAPAFNGGESIDSYNLTVTPVVGGSPKSFTSTTTTASLTGLAPGTQYIASVAASNAAGPGPAVTSATFITNPAMTLSAVRRIEALGVAITPIATTLLAEAGSTATYSISGSLPAGLTFDTTNGIISGTPTDLAASETFTVTASVNIGGSIKTASAEIVLGVVAGIQATLVLTGSSATVGSAATLTRSGGSGTGIVTYAITGGTATGCAVNSSGVVTSTGAGTCIATATKAGDATYASTTSAPATVTFTAAPAPAPAPVPAPAPAPAPAVTPTPVPSASPTPAPTVTPTPVPSASPTPAPSNSPVPTPTPKPSASPTPPPSVKPTQTPAPSIKPTPSTSPTPAPTVKPTPATSPSKKPLDISPPKTGADTSKSSINVQNLVPGQKIKVTIVEGKSLPTPTASPKATVTAKPSPLPSANNFKATSKEPVKVIPKPSGSSAGFGINNLKPGQKIKVTIKTGGTKK